RVAAVGDLSQLTYNRMVLDESMRLYPPAWILGRRALADDKLGDEVIPAGSVVAMCPYTMHRNPAFWEEPEEFRPERFTRDRAARRAPVRLLPLRRGPSPLHRPQLRAARVPAHHRDDRPAIPRELVPDHRVVPERLFVLRPRGGLPMVVHPA